MSDLVEFLRARLDEDEAVARAVIPPGRPLENGAASWFASTDAAIGDRSGYVVAYSVASAECREHIARHDPTRVLREVEAKRRIVDNSEWARIALDSVPMGDRVSSRDDALSSYWRGQHFALRTLAAIYADHPDYRDEWR